MVLSAICQASTTPKSTWCVVDNVLLTQQPCRQGLSLAAAVTPPAYGMGVVMASTFFSLFPPPPPNAASFWEAILPDARHLVVVILRTMPDSVRHCPGGGGGVLCLQGDLCQGWPSRSAVKGGQRAEKIF